MRHKLLHLMRGISKEKRERLEPFPLAHSVFCKLLFASPEFEGLEQEIK